MGLKFYLSLLYGYLTHGFAGIHDSSMKRFGMKRLRAFLMGNYGKCRFQDNMVWGRD